MFNNVSYMALASLSEFQEFLAHHICTDVTKALWAGQYDFNSSWLYFKVCKFPMAKLMFHLNHNLYNQHHLELALSLDFGSNLLPTNPLYDPKKKETI